MLTRIPRNFALALALAFTLHGLPAAAETVGGLLGRTVQDRPDRAGKVSDLIVNVQTGRVLYILVDGPQGYLSLPVRALGEDGYLDFDLVDTAAKMPGEGLPELRRARRLLGQSAFAQGRQVGVIQDIVFLAGTGRIAEVLVRSGTRVTGYPPEILAATRSSAAGDRPAKLPDETPQVDERPGALVRPSDVRRQVQSPSRPDESR